MNVPACTGYESGPIQKKKKNVNIQATNLNPVDMQVLKMAEILCWTQAPLTSQVDCCRCATRVYGKLMN